MLSLTYQVARARQAELLAQAELAREQRVARRRLREQRRARRCARPTAAQAADAPEPGNGSGASSFPGPYRPP